MSGHRLQLGAMRPAARRVAPGASGLVVALSLAFGFTGGSFRLTFAADGPVTLQHAQPGAWSASVQPRAVPPRAKPVHLQPATTELRGTLAPAQPASNLPVLSQTIDGSGRRRPLVVLDPGHGGVDPGAVGAPAFAEKTVVLSVALKVAEQLQRRNIVDVALTRTDDRFVTLDQRRTMSEAAKTDLFLSLHADAIGSNLGARVRGASVYTLSEKASDEEARKLADQENAVDARAGLQVPGSSDTGHVRGILVDLMRRETQGFSSEARALLVGHMRAATVLAHAPERQAAFKVLRQPQCPTVLVELGYVSNPLDVLAMREPAWQVRVATSIANAIEAYFAQHPIANDAGDGLLQAAQ